MARPRKALLSLKEKLLAVRNAGLNCPGAIPPAEIDPLENLPNRIQALLHLVKQKPMKSTDMLYLIMYDIENNKVRGLIAKFLLKKGCIRIQKSVYFARSHPSVFTEIGETLKEVRETYDNVDSIILVPVHSKAAGSMRIIGKDIQLDALMGDSSTMFF
jgi:CRISPR-associated endonuclease Cas2